MLDNPLAQLASHRGQEQHTAEISGVTTCRVGAMQASPTIQEVRTELDSHADTCVVGDATALITQDFDKQVRVFGFDGSKSSIAKTVTGVIGYVDPGTGDQFMLVLHQAILVPKMTANLLGLMQLQDNGILINDEPKHMVPKPTEEHHCIKIPGTKDRGPLNIPLSIKGVISYFPTWKPTLEEFEGTPEDRVVELTSENVDWDPQIETRFEEQEEVMLNSAGKLRESGSIDVAHRMVAAMHSQNDHDLPEANFGESLAGTISSISTKDHLHGVRPEDLVKRWNIGLKAANQTIQVTTQRGVRTILHPTLARRFRTNDRQLRYRRLACEVFTDTLEASSVSWYRQNKYAQVFTTNFGWTRVFPMKKKSDAHEGLMDGSKEQTMAEFRKKAREMGCHIKVTEPYSPWQNAAEGAIRELKKGAGRKMARTQAPSKLWDHCLELESFLRSHTALESHELYGQVPETIVSGQTADISPFAEHGWYDWVMWYDSDAAYPKPKEQLGRWLGPAVDIGPAMTGKILKQNGQVLYRSTYRALNPEELESPEHKRLRDAFDLAIVEKIGGVTMEKDLVNLDQDAATPEFEMYQDDLEGTGKQGPDAEEVTPEDLDNYVGAEVNLPVGEAMQHGRVRKRARDVHGDPYGRANNNPILDTRIYEVEFGDGTIGTYAANVIAESMFAQCDAEGNQHILMDEIVDHKSDDQAVKDADKFVVVNGRRHLRKSTKGWKLCVKWKDGSTSWQRLSDLKESFPIQVAEYATAQSIAHEPAFAWWVPYTLKKRDRIIAVVNQRYIKRTHKFGIEVPKTIKRALEIDKENGNTLWRDAIAKEMQAVRIAFKILGDGEKPPPGFQFMTCHMIFDVKLDGFKRKARLVAGGHMTEAPAVLTYSSVVSRESVRIALTLAALNDLELKGSDVQNAYLTAPCEEKIWTTLGPEFGEDEGKKALIVRALYGLKSAGASFNRHISDCMRQLGYQPCRADPDLWFKPVTRPDDGLKYYAYILLYVDDCLCIHHDAESALKELDKYFQMKPGSIGDPDIYLGAKLRLVTLDNGVHAWSASPSKYIQDAVNNVEKYLALNYPGRKLKNNISGPWPNGYALNWMRPQNWTQ